jgi:8-oxo-dGTP pyrophosphatase MutT (NUDIX family)
MASKDSLNMFDALIDFDEDNEIEKNKLSVINTNILNEVKNLNIFINRISSVNVTKTVHNDLQIDDLQIDDLQIDDLQIDDLQVDDLQVDDLQIDDLQVDEFNDDNTNNDTDGDIVYDDTDTEYQYDTNNSYKKFNFNAPFKKNTWKKKEVIYCNNCGKYGHIYKKCFDPITSYGIICIDLNNPNINKFFATKYKFPLDIQQLKNICINKYIQKNISCNNKKDLDFFEQKMEKNNRYLMVRRKYTFNYIHIIRGLYDLELESIVKSINLLTKDEYDNLQTHDFDTLWNNIWNHTTSQKNYGNEYDRAKEQFNLLKNYILPQISHKINVTYSVPEWGFPKGKRNNLESNIECAKREFEEETGLTSSDYELLDRLYPLYENIKGSNGINYRHIYYIAILNSSFNSANLIVNNKGQFAEIGDIGLFNVKSVENIVRKYNTEKVEIIRNLNLFLTYNTRYFEKFYHENK